MTFDLIAFLYILISYLVIYHDARRSAAMNRNDDENRIMQARITRLVVTDFACWGPVCVMAFLNLLGVDMPDVAYAFAAIILLPINSALNPILYSNVLSVLYGSCIKPLDIFVRKRVRVSRAANMTRQRQRSNQSHGSLAITLTSNDCIQSPEGALLMGGTCCTDPVCPTSTTKV
uniref:G-protein coupled receptors family 1 profile domain-containing protein n=2 Tax=Ciona intestinalis TaxID=7719 RepID=H2Y2E5_CIOIN